VKIIPNKIEPIFTPSALNIILISNIAFNYVLLDIGYNCFFRPVQGVTVSKLFFEQNNLMPK
jgi:hypothetical protein